MEQKKVKWNKGWMGRVDEKRLAKRIDTMTCQMSHVRTYYCRNFIKYTYTKT